MGILREKLYLQIGPVAVNSNFLPPYQFFFRNIFYLDSDPTTYIVRSKLMEFKEMVHETNLETSAAGFFSINLTLIPSTLASLITYLIIMLTNQN